MIPRVINQGSIMFVALRRPHTVASDHPNFAVIRDYLQANGEDEEYLSSLVDIARTVARSSNGAVTVHGNTLFFGDEKLSDAWVEKAMDDPLSTRVFQVRVGDRVRIEGDEDAPDGVYVVGEVDNTDTSKRVYVESDEDFFGYIDNTSIKEIIT